MKIGSREYKLLIDHTLLRDRPEAVPEIWHEIRQAARHLPAVRIEGNLVEDGSRFVRFLDTPDATLRRNGLLLRQRWGEGTSELTLKCRSEDLFLAFGTDVSPADGIASSGKFEEDIAPPFLCRFSHSATIAGPAPGPAGDPPDAPESIAEAAAVFPVLGTVRADDRKLHRKVEIRTVQGIVVKESVWKSKTLGIHEDDAPSPLKASFALIVWTRGKADTPVVAEVSFRIKTDGGRLSRSAAVGARSLYRSLLGLDVYRSDARTKTEYVYRDSGRD